MKTNELIELNESELQGISGGTNTPYNINININIAPKISLTIVNKLNLGILVVANSLVNKPISFTQIVL